MKPRDIVAIILALGVVLFFLEAVAYSLIHNERLNEKEADILKYLVASVITILATYLGNKNKND